jgi:hypothetical protein
MENHDKGLLNGSCNRSACQKPGAVYYNHSTRAYYCADCADMINKMNPESHQIYGHDLCTLPEEVASKYKTIDKNNPDVFTTKGFVQAMNGLELWVNTVTDEIITVKVNDSDLRRKLYCKYVRVTIEIIDENEYSG